jgi:hypothetical protein
VLGWTLELLGGAVDLQVGVGAPANGIPTKK